MTTCHARCALLARAHHYHQCGELTPAALLARQAIEARLRTIWFARADGPLRKACPLGRLIDTLERQQILSRADLCDLRSIVKLVNRVIHREQSWSADEASIVLSAVDAFLARTEPLTERGAA